MRIDAQWREISARKPLREDDFLFMSLTDSEKSLSCLRSEQSSPANEDLQKRLVGATRALPTSLKRPFPLRRNVPSSFQTLTILAPGLLGASLGQAARARGLARTIRVWARRAEVRLACEESDWCDSAHADAREAAEGADFVVVCTPVEHIVPLAREVSPVCAEGAIITDVGSTKSRICREAVDLGGRAIFVGAHPMAGSEKSGMEHALADLFEGRTCIVTPLPSTPPAPVDRVVRFWADLGMRVKTVSPEQHDEIVAHVSHLPHLLASILSVQLAGKDPEWMGCAGQGLRDTTRIAAGHAGLWRSICEQNREEILRAMEGFEDEWQRLRSALHNQRFFELEHLLERGKRFRDSL
jgi:cyclohexadieny/prephenate dehydrogenase